jgi:hypothetical protein
LLSLGVKNGTSKKNMDIWPSEIKKIKPKAPEELIQYLQKKGNKIVEKIFKPKYLLTVSEEQTLNQIIDIYAKWHRSSFYFCVKYKCPPDAHRQSFENKFVRLEYLGNDEFQYSHMRHTGKWNPIFKMTTDECLKHVASEVPF